MFTKMSQTYTQTLHAQNVHAYRVLSCLKKSRNARLQGYNYATIRTKLVVVMVYKKQLRQKGNENPC